MIYKPALPPMITASFWPKSSTECLDAKSIQAAVFNKPSSRPEANIKQNMATKEEVPRGRKVGGLMQEYPTPRPKT